MNPYFVCLTMIVSGRAWNDGPTLTALDCLAHVIEREGDDKADPWHVMQAQRIFPNPPQEKA